MSGWGANGRDEMDEEVGGDWFVFSSMGVFFGGLCGMDVVWLLSWVHWGRGCGLIPDT